MFKNIINDIGGIEIYGIVSICVFFVVFTTAIVWAMLLNKPFLKNMSQLPLEDGSDASGTKGHSHE